MSDTKRNEIRTLSLKGIPLVFSGGTFSGLSLNCEAVRKKRGFLLKNGESSERSLILRSLAGLAKLQANQFHINDLDVADMSFEEFLPFRMNLGFGFSFGGLMSNMSLRENLMLPIFYHQTKSVSQAEEFLDDLLSPFSLEKFQHLRPAMVPGRIRKLTCILRAFVLEPQILLLDEPMVGLSEAHRKLVCNLANEHLDRPNSILVLNSTEPIPFADQLLNRLDTLFISEKIVA